VSRRNSPAAITSDSPCGFPAGLPRGRVDTSVLSAHDGTDALWDALEMEIAETNALSRKFTEAVIRPHPP